MLRLCRLVHYNKNYQETTSGVIPRDHRSEPLSKEEMPVQTRARASCIVRAEKVTEQVGEIAKLGEKSIKKQYFLSLSCMYSGYYNLLNDNFKQNHIEVSIPKDMNCFRKFYISFCLILFSVSVSAPEQLW